MLMGGVSIVLDHAILDVSMNHTFFPLLLVLWTVFTHDLGEYASKPASMVLSATQLPVCFPSNLFDLSTL